ncbi:diguanylate cyclase [Calderihabitans maritimus]|uniref:Diguanylate cyclase GGDEF domain-containing protein n=1 Tax=Calderihabitans maritimus TaxID=1246530 RepID=A0A1Z5HXX6_9FIRM|nr:diguanylate cyclase [Calderihabitans maritimus]GAW94227.1 diguanylate cyclase GGDEF domain-containing protein [Calderihabitans maritimus]
MTLVKSGQHLNRIGIAFSVIIVLWGLHLLYDRLILFHSLTAEAVFVGGGAALLGIFLLIKFTRCMNRQWEEQAKAYQELQKELEQKVKELTALHYLSQEEYLTQSLELFLQHLLETTCQIFQAPAGEVLLLDEDTGELTYKAAFGLSKEYVSRIKFKPGEGIIGRSALGEIVCTEDLNKDPRVKYPLENRLEGFRALMSVPLRLNEKIIGVMAVRAVEPRTFSSEDAQLLSTMANHAAHAIERQMMYRQLKEANEKLTLLYRIGKTLAKKLDLDEVFATLLEEILKAVEIERCSLFEVDQETGVIRGKISSVMSKEEIEKIVLPLEKSPVGMAVASGNNTLVIEDVSKIQTLSEESRGVLEKFGIKSMAVVLIKYGEKVAGAITLSSADYYRFTPQELELVEAVAEQAGIAIENARLYEEVSRIAITDELTGLFTRIYFNRRLEEEWARANRYDSSLSLVMIDIDDFKQVNDTRGHKVGDEVLKKVAYIIKNNLRASDVAARYGGDEFVLILPDTAEEGAVSVAEKIRKAVSELSDPKVTISAGVAVYQPGKYKNAEEMLIAADMAMYSAKSNLKNRTYIIN